MVSSRKAGGKRAALYLRVSTGEQTTDNQRRELDVAARTNKRPDAQ
jgi:DNA invertase Pin-like site-specific DNA recombinase